VAGASPPPAIRTMKSLNCILIDIKLELEVGTEFICMFIQIEQKWSYNMQFFYYHKMMQDSYTVTWFFITAKVALMS
jgi:hypothetical protein